MSQIASLQTDFYKLFHKEAYLGEIDYVYGNYTSRSGRLSNIRDNDTVAFVGLQYYIKDVLIDQWNKTFFWVHKEEAVAALKRIVDSCLGIDYDASHFEALHDLGYLPIKIKALPEGSLVPYQVAPITFVNTVKGFGWLSNYIETSMSTENWPIQTACTTSIAYKKAITKAFEETGGPMELLPFMVHDFSFRGMPGRHAAALTGFGHLASGNVGTDTVPAILFAEEFYNANVEKELVGASVKATEHSTATSAIAILVEKYGITKLQAEVMYVQYLFTKAPTNVLSHVSDSFDFFDFVVNGLPLLKEEIMARDGTFVIRPDSGDPVEILCGAGGYLLDNGLYRVWDGSPDDSHSTFREVTEAESKGLIQLLWEEFGGTETLEGYKLLDSHIGAIYGDSITLERQEQIIKRLMAKGFVPTVVLGVGSYSFQYVTRDTHGSAVKATNVIAEGENVAVCKDPATDSKKKSAKGLLRVEKENGTFVMYDEQTPEQEAAGELKTVFWDGNLMYETSLAEIRALVASQI